VFPGSNLSAGGASVSSRLVGQVRGDHICVVPGDRQLAQAAQRVVGIYAADNAPGDGAQPVVGVVGVIGGPF
jgi:hypothetical protein